MQFKAAKLMISCLLIMASFGSAVHNCFPTSSYAIFFVALHHLPYRQPTAATHGCEVSTQDVCFIIKF